MAFAVTKYRSYGIALNGPTPQECLQEFEIAVTATASDVSYDFSDAAGTFWTAALADATYGAIAAQALATLQSITSQVTALRWCEGGGLRGKVQSAAAASSGEYSMTITTHTPVLAYHAGEGPLTPTFVISWILPDNRQAVNGQAG